MSLPKLLTRKFFFQINIFFKARDILDVLGKHMELIISQSKNHAAAHKSPSMKARNSQTRKGGVEGRGQSTRSYFKISTLCRRLRSCIPLDLHVTSDYFLVSGTQKAERCQPYDIQIQEILEAMAHNK
jgi:hypothetical protein